MVRSCQINGRADPISFKDTDVPLKIPVDKYKFLERNIENIDVPDCNDSYHK